MATTFIQRSYRDWSGEVSKFDLTTYPLTGANFAAHQGHQAALDAAIAALTSGELANTGFGVRELVSADNGPFGANRENKILVTYKGAVSEKIFRSEIPCPSLIVDHFIPNSDELAMTNGDVAAFVTAFEDLVTSPDNGTEAVVILSMRHVGRNI